MKNGIAAAALLVALGTSTSLLGSVPAAAQDMEEALHRLHHACDRGDRAACVRFGVIIGEHRELRDEWRRHHPEYFGWWEEH